MQQAPDPGGIPAHFDDPPAEGPEESPPEAARGLDAAWEYSSKMPQNDTVIIQACTKPVGNHKGIDVGYRGYWEMLAASAFLRSLLPVDMQSVLFLVFR